LICLRSDNGCEYCNKEFDNYCLEHGIHKEKAVPRIQQENGMSERMNREASSSLEGGIQEEAWTAKKANYSFLKTFNCEAFIHINKENRTRLETKIK